MRDLLLKHKDENVYIGISVPETLLCNEIHEQTDFPERWRQTSRQGVVSSQRIMFAGKDISESTKTLSELDPDEGEELILRVSPPKEDDDRYEDYERGIIMAAAVAEALDGIQGTGTGSGAGQGGGKRKYRRKKTKKTKKHSYRKKRSYRKTRLGKRSKIRRTRKKY